MPHKDEVVESSESGLRGEQGRRPVVKTFMIPDKFLAFILRAPGGTIGYSPSALPSLPELGPTRLTWMVYNKRLCYVLAPVGFSPWQSNTDDQETSEE